MLPAMDYTYKYAFPSGVIPVESRKTLTLSDFYPGQINPFLCDGGVRFPKMFGDMLLTLGQLMQPYGFMPHIRAFPDPLLTINDEMLRLEGFNYGGIYVRVDLPLHGFHFNDCRLGSTNVNFNQQLQHSLKHIRDWDLLNLTVGQRSRRHHINPHKKYEKRVKVPLVCMNGFREVQASQHGLHLRWNVSAAEGVRLMRTIPGNGHPKRVGYIVQNGNHLRFSQRFKEETVNVSDPHRLKNLEPLLLRAKQFKGWSNDKSSVSAFEVIYPHGRFYLLINPSAESGFLEKKNIPLSQKNTLNIISKVKGELNSQAKLDSALIARRVKETESDVRSTLPLLLDQGLAGFDVANGHFFHRELPFDMALVETLTTRLSKAKELAMTGRVIELNKRAGETAYLIAGNSTNHRVHIRLTGDSCTCPWFTSHQGEAGPCKHILAAQLFNISR